MLFKFAQQSHVNDFLVEAGQNFEVPPAGRDKETGKPIWHIPGPHWEPLDDEAKALCAKLKHEFTGEVPDVLTGLAQQLEAASGAAKIDSEALGKAVAFGVAEALRPILEAQAAMLPVLAALAKQLAGKPGKAEKAAAEADPKDAGATGAGA